MNEADACFILAPENCTNKDREVSSIVNKITSSICLLKSMSCYEDRPHS